MAIVAESETEAEIRDVVARIHQRFQEATVRNYVPVLVARQARLALLRSVAVQGSEGHLVGA